MKRICILLGGGLGDVICQVYAPFYHFNKIMSYVQSGQAEVKMLLVCDNIGCTELFNHQDWIDEVKRVPYCLPNQTNILYDMEWRGRELIQTTTPISHSVTKKFDIILSEDEKEYIKKLTETPFVLFHPYAGQDDRKNVGNEMFEKAKQMTNGDQILLLGRNFERVAHGKEENVYGNEVIDLIDKLSVTQTIELSRHPNCKGMVVTHSAMVIIAWLWNVNVTCYVPSGTQSEQQMKCGYDNPWNFGRNNGKTETIYY